MKLNAFGYIVFIFIFLNIVDIITTMYILPGESNPLYLATNNLFFMLVLKVGIMGFILWIYYRNKYKSISMFYFLICILVYGSLALFIAQVINIYAILNPVVLQQAALIPAEEKARSYNEFMSMIYLFPIIFSMITFWIYNKSVKDIIIYTEKRKWYQIWK